MAEPRATSSRRWPPRGRRSVDQRDAGNGQEGGPGGSGPAVRVAAASRAAASSTRRRLARHVRRNRRGHVHRRREARSSRPPSAWSPPERRRPPLRRPPIRRRPRALRPSRSGRRGPGFSSWTTERRTARCCAGGWSDPATSWRQPSTGGGARAAGRAAVRPRAARRADAGARRLRRSGGHQGDADAARHSGDHDFGARRDAEHRALHRARRRGLPAQAVRSGAAARADQRLTGEEAAARPGEGIPAAGGSGDRRRHRGRGRATTGRASWATWPARDDELGRLARVFDGMVSQLKAREDRLRERVRDLRAEIEQARRDSKEFGAAVDGGQSQDRRQLRAALRDPRGAGARRHGDGVPGARPRAGGGGRDQDAAARVPVRRDAAAALQGRDPAGAPPVGSEHRPHPRFRRVVGGVLSHHGVRRGHHGAGAARHPRPS